MEPGDAPPQPLDILRWCADSAPELWFPSVHAEKSGRPRESLENPLWLLRQTGLVRVGDWVKGRGQGFCLTPAGIEAINDPSRIPKELPKHPYSQRLAQEAEDDEWRPGQAKTPQPKPVASKRTEPNPGETRFDRGEAVRDAALYPKPGLVTSFLLFANVIWFGIGLVVAWRLAVPAGDYLRDGNIDTLLRTGAAHGPNILEGEWWRLISCCFVHIGLLHLFGNMFALGMIGPLAESCLGRWRFAVVYLVAGFAGSCFAMAMNPMSVLAGASGAVWGVMTSLFVWLFRNREHLPPYIVNHWLRMLGIVLLVNAGISFAPGISWQGHLGGAVAGTLVSLLLDWSRLRGKHYRRPLQAVGAVLAVGVALTGPLGLWYATNNSNAWLALRAMVEFRKLVEADPKGVQINPLFDPLRVAEDIGTLAGVQPVQAKAVQKAVTIALISRNESNLTEAKEIVGLFRTGVANSKARFANQSSDAVARIRKYLDAADAFAERLDQILAKGTQPTEAQWQEVGAEMKNLEALWAEMMHAIGASR